jgi:DMSO/TMAO reductase YedYZ molybdopterin-dependent catalytic subunit
MDSDMPEQSIPFGESSQVHDDPSTPPTLSNSSASETPGSAPRLRRAPQAPKPRRVQPTSVPPTIPDELVLNAVVAGLISVAIALLARFFLNISTPAELFGDKLIHFIPLPIFSHLLDLFGHSTKHIYFGGLLLAEAVIMAVAGVVYWRLRVLWLSRSPRLESWLSPQGQPDFREVPVIALVFCLVSLGLVAPLLGAGFFGSEFIGGWTSALLSQLIPDVTFAIAFIVLLRRSATRAASATAAQAALSRRRLLRQIGLGALVIAGGALAWDFITGGAASLFGLGGTSQPPLKLGTVPKHIPPPVPNYGPWTNVPGETPEVTSAADFYYVSKNLASDPSIDSANWQLQVSGLVKSPYGLTYDQLRALPQVQQYHTLECISNVIGGDLISNALFVGVSLADVIQKAGIQNGASDLIFRAADGYSDSLHMSQALNPESLIVYLIDGVPLPQPHGYPARLLIPGLYGMKNGKWITSLEVSSGSYTGYWEQQGWSDEAVVKTMARIDVPLDSDLLLAKTMYIAGIAFAGDRGISRVDVSTDSGQTWNTATLRRPLGNLTWVLWEYSWTPAGSGAYIIVARAVDGLGNVQQPDQEPPLPDGASGYDAISVTVR